MKSFFLFLLIFITNPLFAQNHFLGLKSGVNFSNIQSNFNKNSVQNTGYIGGLTYEYAVNKNYNLGIDLLYSERGFSNQVIFTDEKGFPTGQEFQIEYDFKYISLPIKAGFSIGDKFRGFGNIGLISSYLLNAQSYAPAIKLFGETENITTEITKYYNQFNLDGILEIGAAYNFGNKFVAFTTLDYQYGITNLINIKDSENNMYHRGMSFSIGFRYALKKE